MRTLEENGFTLHLLQECSELDIEKLAPSYLTDVEALKLKIALRKERIEEKNMKLHKNFQKFVGRVSITFKDGVVQQGNAVLVYKQGVALTANHILQRDQSNDVRRKRKKKEVAAIEVTFPNTSEGLLQYSAKVIHTCGEDDLTLLEACKPLETRFDALQTLYAWPPYYPEEGDAVTLLSFPAGKGEEAPVSHTPSAGDDFPWVSTGVVTCVDAPKGQGFANYTSFGGSSGALLVHALADGRVRTAVHLGIYHETEDLRAWNRSQLNQLNEGLGEKGYNGYFTTKVGPFLQSYFGAYQKVLPEFQHHQVAMRKRVRNDMQNSAARPKEAEIEELDLFGLWPGLDDINEDKEKAIAQEL